MIDEKLYQRVEEMAKRSATLEREQAEIFIAAPMSESQHLIDRKQLLEQIAALEEENGRLKEMMSAMPESFWEAQPAIGKEAKNV